MVDQDTHWLGSPIPSISAEELDLLTFFECEPKKLDADVPWIYNDLLYECKQEDLSLSFAVAPSYKDVRLILKHREAVLYELNAVGVDDVKYHNDSGRETLEIVINDQDRFWLHLRPSLYISHEAKERT